MRLIRLAAPIVALLLTSAAFADMVDNPEYTQWAKFKVGTSVTHTTNISASQQNMTQSQTMKIAAESADAITIETAMSMNMGGRAMAMPASSRVIPAKIDNSKPVAPDMPGVPTAHPDVKVDAQAATETVDVSGQKFTCKVVSTTIHTPQGDMTAKSWVSDDMPGSLVKMESTDKDGKTVIKSDTTDVQIKK